MNGGSFKMVVCLAATVLTLCCAGNALAKAKGECVNCHTMHNSQNGIAVTKDSAGVTSTTPVEALLSYQSCLACHTGVNTGLDAGVMNGTGIPYVLTTGGPTYTHASPSSSLAGGNFYWVQTDDTTGHNVVAANTDTAFVGQNPPGWSTTFTVNGAVGTDWANNQLTCAGTYGCHGTHGADVTDFAAVKGAHHADDSAIDGSTVAKSYRFLNGIVGKEDIDWEYTKAADDHNQYHGSARTAV